MPPSDPETTRWFEDAVQPHESDLRTYLRAKFSAYNLGESYGWDRYQVRLYIDNLADDKDYIQQAGARISGPGLATATGRNIRFSATVKF